MRILYHAINGIGLGHLMRLSAIAAAVRHKAPHVHQFIATSATYPPHLRRLQMPVMILPGDDAGPFLGPDRRSRCVSARFSSRVLKHVIDEYDPRVVVFDTHAPWPLVQKVVEEGRHAVIVYRRCREEFLLKNLRDGFLARFHLVLVPHCADEFQEGLGRATLRAFEKLETVRYVGPVVDPDLASAACQADVSSRHELSPSDELIVITQGGGGGGLGRLNRALLERACQAAVRLRKKRPTVRVICVGGPYAKPFPVPDGCVYVGEEPCLPALIARADLVIATPGYNTVQEIVQGGARALFVPKKTKMEDIEARIEWLVRRGRAHSLELDARPHQCEHVIEELLNRPRPAPEPCTGAANAAAEVLLASKAPRRYLCSREPLSASLATSFPSPRRLARALLEETEIGAIVRVDWDRVEKLFQELGPSAGTAIAALEIVLGKCKVEEAGRRVRTVYEFLQARAFPHEELLFSVDDPSGGRLLAELTGQIRDLRYKALVARFTQDALQRDPEAVFESLELCRNLVPNFKIDITVLDNGFVFVDQP
jgi:predicted glycosyltransferase